MKVTIPSFSIAKSIFQSLPLFTVWIYLSRQFPNIEIATIKMTLYRMYQLGSQHKTDRTLKLKQNEESQISSCGSAITSLGLREWFQTEDRAGTLRQLPIGAAVTYPQGGSQGNETLPSAPSLQSPLSSNRTRGQRCNLRSAAQVSPRALERGGEEWGQWKGSTWWDSLLCSSCFWGLINNGHFALSAPHIHRILFSLLHRTPVTE